MKILYISIYCVVNRQQLVSKIYAKKLKIIPLIYDFLNNSAKKTMKKVNVTSTLHTEVRWLCKGNCLDGFYAVYIVQICIRISSRK